MSRTVHSGNVEKLVARQGRLWDLKRQSEKEGLRNGRGKVGEVSFGPYVLISREKGAGGIDLADLMGQRLGWLVFDRAIVDEISREAHVREQLVEKVDEHVRGNLEEIIRDMLMPQGLGTDSYLYNLRHVVLTLGHQGEVVILGRGAEYILPAQFGLRVRLVAPLEARIRHLHERDGISLEAARKEIQKVDPERKEFARRSFDRDVEDPLNYDLVINTGAMGMKMEPVAALVLAALAQKLGVEPAKKAASG
jgi:Cytidylate kinase-like family